MNRFHQVAHQHKQLFAALILAIILPLSAGVIFLIANAVYPNLSGTGNVPNNKQHEEIVTQPPRNGNLPDSVVQAVLEDASRRLNVPTQELRIVQAEPRDWPDGCLGLASPDTFCTQIVVSGWQVMVEGKQQSFVYRTNDSGSLVKLVKE
jgi:hypothetical protein